jgi:hypothetical protein
LQLCSPRASAGVGILMPQHRHRFSQYSYGPHVVSPHGTSPRGAPPASGAPLAGGPVRSPIGGLALVRGPHDAVAIRRNDTTAAITGCRFIPGWSHAGHRRAARSRRFTSQNRDAKTLLTQEMLEILDRLASQPDLGT